MDNEVRNRFTVLTWRLTVIAALVIANTAIMVNLSYQVSQIAGKLSVLISHVQMR